MEPGFIKADSTNLPRVDLSMILTFLSTNPLHFSAETKNIKVLRNTRENYGDEAVGKVQVKREEESSFCTVRAKITPEHRIHVKGYEVESIINEDDEDIVSCICKDCVASEGGCKHGIAFLFWLLRRTEEPSVTSVECYWKTSKLSKIGNEAAVPLRALMNVKIPAISQSDDDFLKLFLEKGKQCCSKSVLSQMETQGTIKQLSLHCLGINYVDELNNSPPNVKDFKSFCMKHLDEKISMQIEELTRNQYKCGAWHEARYGRITASKAYDVSRCKTSDGALVQSIFGAATFEPTEAMKRGILLEEKVRKIVKEKMNINIKKCGVVVNPSFPFFGASPDGVTSQYCIEIKCPSKEKTVKNYLLSDDKIAMKSFTQLQIQMFLCKKSAGLFCVAAPNFESTNDVKIIEIQLDEMFCLDIIKKCEVFFENHIFKKLLY